MQLVLELADLIFLGVGFLLGYIAKTIQCKTGTENLEELFFGLIIMVVWVYTKIVLQVDDWWINLFAGLVLAHFFDFKVLKDKLGGLIK